MTNEPSCIEAEESILSSVFLDGVSALSKLMDGHIREECFAKQEHALIFRTFLWMHKNGRALTLDVMVAELDRVQKLEQVGGVPGLSRVSSKMATTLELKYFIERVRETYVQRELIAASDRIKALAQAQEASVEAYTHEVNKILSIRHATQTIKTLPEAATSAIEHARRIADGSASEEDLGYTWPWPDMNLHFGPACAGQLIVLAARPGIGKSTVARQTCLHVCSKYGNVMLFSREMPVDELPPLFAQTISGYSWKHFRTKKLHLKEQAEFISALTQVQNLSNLHVFDQDRTLAQLIARTKSFAQVKPLKFLAVDYLQRYDPCQEKGETRDIALGRFTCAMKDLAVDLKIPVLLLCQVGRGAERDKRPPMLHDLRESGNIESDADRVIFLTAPEIDKITGLQQDIFDDTVSTIYVEATQAKGRGDGRGRCDLYLHKPTATFRSVARGNNQ